MYLLQRCVANHASWRTASRVATPPSSRARKDQSMPSRAFCEAAVPGKAPGAFGSRAQLLKIARPSLSRASALCSSLIRCPLGSSSWWWARLSNAASASTKVLVMQKTMAVGPVVPGDAGPSPALVAGCKFLSLVLCNLET